MNKSTLIELQEELKSEIQKINDVLLIKTLSREESAQLKAFKNKLQVNLGLVNYHYAMQFEDKKKVTLASISRFLGLTRERVRQLLNNSLMKLQNYSNRSKLQSVDIYNILN